MAQSCWDPANLLQITLDQYDTWGEIQCVGVARSQHNNRCRWTIEDPDRAKIRPLLVQMSKTKPELTTTESLRKLAVYCLCPSYHSGQVGEVVARWTKVVQNAAQHHKNLAILSGASPTNESLLKETQKKIFHFGQSLEAEKTAASQFAVRTLGGTNQLQIESSSWKEKFERLQEEKKIQEALVQKIEADKKAWATEAAGRLVATINSLETKVTSLEQELAQAQEEKESQLADISSLEKANEDLKGKMMEQVPHGKEFESQKRRLEEVVSELQSCQTEREAQKVTIKEMELCNAKLEEAMQTISIKHEDAIQETHSIRIQLEDETAKLQTVWEKSNQVSQNIELLEEEISKLRNEESSSLERLEKLRLECDKSDEANETLRQEAKTKDQLLEQLQSDLTQEQARVRALEKEISDAQLLQDSIAQSRDEKSGAELEAKDKSLRRARADLDRDRARISQLESEISQLQVSESGLKESIASCWLHGFCAWFAKSKKHSWKKRQDMELGVV